MMKGQVILTTADGNELVQIDLAEVESLTILGTTAKADGYELKQGNKPKPCEACEFKTTDSYFLVDLCSHPHIMEKSRTLTRWRK